MSYDFIMRVQDNYLTAIIIAVLLLFVGSNLGFWDKKRNKKGDSSGRIDSTSNLDNNHQPDNPNTKISVEDD